MDKNQDDLVDVMRNELFHVVCITEIVINIIFVELDFVNPPLYPLSLDC